MSSSNTIEIHSSECLARQFVASIERVRALSDAAKIEIVKTIVETDEEFRVRSLVPLEGIERQYIAFVLKRSATQVEAAALLGIDLATLYRKRKRYRMNRDGTTDQNGQL